MPAMIIGGKALGLAHNKYQAGSFTVNQFWGRSGQALGYTATTAPFAAPCPRARARLDEAGVDRPVGTTRSVCPRPRGAG